MKKKILSLLLAFALLLGLSACSDKKPDDQTTVAPSATGEILFPQEGDLEAVAVSTEHFSLSKGEMVYLYVLSVSDFLNTYYDYLAYIGLNTATTFKTQQSMFGGDGETWFDYFLTDASLYAQDYLIFCEAALANGLKLDQEDEAYIADQKKILEEEAARYGWSLNTYLEQLYATNLDWKYVESTYRITRLAQKAYKYLVGNHEFTEAEIEAEYQKNSKFYSLADIYAVDFGDGENIPAEVLETVRESLKTVTSFEDFRAVVKAFLLATRTTQAIEDAGGLDKYTDKYLEQDLVTGQEYSSGSEVLDWAFADDTEEGSVYVRENSATNAPYGYYLARKPYRDETVTIDVRHILFLLQSSGGSYETIEQAHSEAERIHQQWISEGQTVEGFISLCAQYSEDGNAGSGGLYTDVPPGKMVQPFNDWCFDESRKVGDHGVVDTQYGAHIMYFEGRYIAWSRGAEQALSDTLYDEVYAAQESRTPVSFHDDVLSSINW